MKKQRIEGCNCPDCPKREKLPDIIIFLMILAVAGAFLAINYFWK